jgi:hypothetical protein
MMERRRFGVLIAAAIVATTLGPSTAAVAATRYKQSFRYVGGAKQKQQRDAAIEKVVEQLNFIIRGIARRRLKDSNTIIPILNFSLGPEKTVTTYVNGSEIRAPADGSTIPWVDQYGETIRVSHTIVGDELIQRMRGAHGNRDNTYRFSADGEHMRMSVKVWSALLPEPVRYSLSYKLRKPR